MLIFGNINIVNINQVYNLYTYINYMNNYIQTLDYKTRFYKIINCSIIYTQLSFKSSYNFFNNLKFLIYVKPSLSLSIVLFLKRGYTKIHHKDSLS